MLIVKINFPVFVLKSYMKKQKGQGIVAFFS